MDWSVNLGGVSSLYDDIDDGAGSQQEAAHSNSQPPAPPRRPHPTQRIAPLGGRGRRPQQRTVPLLEKEKVSRRRITPPAAKRGLRLPRPRWM
jgi:hypothetical protein